MQNQPVPWKKVALAILPGIVLVAYKLTAWQPPDILLEPEDSPLLSLMLLCAVPGAIGLIRERTAAVWSLPALGILLGVPMLALILLILSIRPELAWIEVALGILVLALYVLYYAVPILVGLPFARKVGVLAALISIGVVYVFDEAFGPLSTRPCCEMSLGVSAQALFMANMASPLFFLILLPVTIMRLSSTRARAVGYLVVASIALASMAHTTAALFSIEGTVWGFVVWGFVSTLLPLLIALGLYARVGRKARQRVQAANPSPAGAGHTR